MGPQPRAPTRVSKWTTGPPAVSTTKTFTQPAHDPPNILHEVPEPLQQQTTPFYAHNPTETNRKEDSSYGKEGKIWNPYQDDSLADNAK